MTTKTAFIEWQSTIHSLPTTFQILGQKAGATTEVIVTAINENKLFKHHMNHDANTYELPVISG